MKLRGKTIRRSWPAGLTAVAAVLLAAPQGLRAQAPNPEALAEGARLYGQTCGRCHNPRPATERTDREWLTVVNHMRARANLTRSQAESILVFMQATNGVGGTSVATAPGPSSAEPPAVTIEDVESMLADLELRLRGLSPDRVSTLTPDEKVRVLEYLRGIRERQGDDPGADAEVGAASGVDPR